MDLETKEYHAELLNHLDEQFWYDVILSRQDVFKRQENITNVCIENNKLMEDTRFCPTSNWKAEIARELKNAAKPGMVFGDLALTLGMIDGYRYARSVQAELKLKGTSLELNVYSARLKKNARPESNTQVRLPGSAVIKQDSQKLRLRQKSAIAQLKNARSKSKSQVRHSASALIQEKLQTLLPLHLQSENKQSSSRRAAPKDQNSSSSDNAKSSNATIRIAQVRINGGIVSNQNLENFVQNLDCIANDASISSIILRIDSSGGSFIASDTLSEAVQYAKAKKPVVASIGGMAASGPYYVAANASKIIANRGSLIGSIGVTSMVLDFSTFLQRFGVTYESLYVGVPATIFETQTEEQAAARETRVQYLYQKFVEHVGKHRQIPHEVVDEHLAQGRLFTGEQAFYNGLIDGLGGMQFAKETACDLVKKQNVAKWNTAVCEVIEHRCIPSNSFNLKSLIE
jgi:signal peptide peptidase SppA